MIRTDGAQHDCNIARDTSKNNEQSSGNQEQNKNLNIGFYDLTNVLFG
jgi:hypothetical protein